MFLLIVAFAREVRLDDRSDLYSIRDLLSVNGAPNLSTTTNLMLLALSVLISPSHLTLIL
jgi:hypothetical protein